MSAGGLGLTYRRAQVTLGWRSRTIARFLTLHDGRVMASHHGVFHLAGALFVLRRVVGRVLAAIFPLGRQCLEPRRRGEGASPDLSYSPSTRSRDRRWTVAG